MNKAQIIENLRELAPWHMDIPLPKGLRTGDYPTNPNIEQEINVINPRGMKKYFSRLYGSGLEGKRMLDVGCNSGGYCFLAKKMGADYTYGFDPRDHWIKQAKFVQGLKQIPDSQMQFVEQDFRTFEHLDIESFDFTLFKGVFYHLSDPIRAVEILASKTKDYMIIDSACNLEIPESAMISQQEGITPLMSGIEGLCWYPGGPMAILNICKQFGFEHKRVLYFRKNIEDKRSFAKEAHGRCAVLVARSEELIRAFVNARKG